MTEQEANQFSQSTAPAPSAPSAPAMDSVFPGVFDTAKSAWEIYKQRFWVIIKLVLIPVATVFVLGGIIAIASVVLLGPLPNFNTMSVFSGSGLLASIASGGAIMIAIVVTGIIFLIGAIILGIWSKTALLVVICDRAEIIGAKESLRRAWPKARSYFWITILAGFVIMGGFMLAIVPGIIFFVWFNLAAYVFISEDIKGMNALLKSKEYVKGRWWGVFWRFFGFGLLIAAASIILNLIPFVNFISGFVSVFVFSPLGLIYGFLVYGNLKSLKGEFEFVPKGRGLFIGFAIFGILLLILLLLGIFSWIQNYGAGTPPIMPNSSGQNINATP